MLTFLTLVTLLFLGGVVVSVLALAGALVKFTISIALWPLKLLLVPLILVAIVVKFVLVITFVSVVFAVLIPLAFVGFIFAAPFLLVAALT